MDYTSKAPLSSSTRLPSPHVSPQMTQGEESHFLCQSGQGGPQDSSTGNRAFCCAPTAWAPLKGWSTLRDPRGSAATGPGCVPAALLRFENAAWFLYSHVTCPAENLFCHGGPDYTDSERNRNQKIWKEQYDSYSTKDVRIQFSSVIQPPQHRG